MGLAREGFDCFRRSGRYFELSGLLYRYSWYSLVTLGGRGERNDWVKEGNASLLPSVMSVSRARLTERPTKLRRRWLV
jgi:hypothetical protein